MVKVQVPGDRPTSAPGNTCSGNGSCHKEVACEGSVTCQHCGAAEVELIHFEKVPFHSRPQQYSPSPATHPRMWSKEHNA